MANKKVTELTADTTVRPSDVTVTVDLAANETKKATWTNVVLGLNGLVATLSGSTFSGPIVAANNGGITGSITRTTAGTPFITVPAGNMITLTTGSNGQIILSGSGDGTGGGGGAPTSAQYLALATDATLTAERVFTPSTGLKATDGGVNGAYTVIVHDGTFAALTGSVFTGPVTASLGISASFYTYGPAAIATIGRHRLGRGIAESFLTTLDSAGSTDLMLIHKSAVDALYLGTNEAFTAQVPAIRMYASAGGVLALGLGGSTGIYITTAGVGVYQSRNLGVYGDGSAFPDAGGGTGVVAIGNATTAPSTLPVAGTVTWSESGDLKIRNIRGETFNASQFATGSGNALKVIHSGSTIRAYDRYLLAHEGQATEVTTTGSPSKAIFTFSSGSHFKTYGTDVIVTATSTSTTGSGYFKLSGHYIYSGSTIALVGSVETVKNSSNHFHLTASLTSSAGNIIVSGSQGASSESFRWGCFFRTQEQGSA